MLIWEPQSTTVIRVEARAAFGTAAIEITNGPFLKWEWMCVVYKLSLVPAKILTGFRKRIIGNHDSEACWLCCLCLY